MKPFSIQPFLQSMASERKEATSALRTGKRAARYASIPPDMQFKLSSRNAEASLAVMKGGVIIKTGSRVSDTVTNKFELSSPTYAALRRQLCESGVIAQTPRGLVFTRDQYFASGSAAASVARGAASNADWWKNNEGKTLGEYIREAKAKS